MAMKKNQHNLYMKYRCLISTQFLVYFIYVLTYDYAYYVVYRKNIDYFTGNKHHYDPNSTLFMMVYNQTAGFLGAAMIVFSKPIEDSFAIFNRLGANRLYSIFQYPLQEEQQDTYQRLLREGAGMGRG